MFDVDVKQYKFNNVPLNFVNIDLTASRVIKVQFSTYQGVNPSTLWSLTSLPRLQLAAAYVPIWFCPYFNNRPKIIKP